MTDRIPLDNLTSDQLDQLYAEVDRLGRLRIRVQSAADEARGSMRDWLIDALADVADPREPSTAQTFREQAARAEAANTRVRNLVARIRQGAPWTANDDDIADHIVAALDDQAPAASPVICELPHQTVTEEDECERKRLTPTDGSACSCGGRFPIHHLHADEHRPVDEPAAWTPPPPGDRREQLPDHILALLDIPPYTSTACEAASLLAWQMPKRRHRRAELGDHADRLHSRCRINNKFTGKSCSCPCHQQAATDPDDLTGAWTPDPPLGCAIPRHRRERMLRGEVDTLAGKVAYRMGMPKKDFNYWLRKEGFPPRAKATIEDLERMEIFLAKRLGES